MQSRVGLLGWKASGVQSEPRLELNGPVVRVSQLASEVQIKRKEKGGRLYKRCAKKRGPFLVKTNSFSWGIFAPEKRVFFKVRQ